MPRPYAHRQLFASRSLEPPTWTLARDGRFALFETRRAHESRPVPGFSGGNRFDSLDTPANRQVFSRLSP